MNKKTSAATITRTVLLILALINQILEATGHSVIPVSSGEVSELISTVFTIATALWAWWKNNSFTQSAKAGDVVKDAVRLDIVTYDDINKMLNEGVK